MGLEFWDYSLRGGAAALFLLLALLFARSWRQSTTARLGVLLTLGGIGYLAMVAIDLDGRHAWRVPFHLASNATPPLFWLFASSWFDDEFEVQRWHWGVVAGFLFLSIGANYDQDYFGDWAIVYSIVWRVLSLCMIALGLRAVARGWSVDLIESRRRVRLALGIVIPLAIAWVILSELAIPGWPPPPGWRVANSLILFLLGAALCATMVGWRDPALIAAPVRATVRDGETGDPVLLARLDAEMREERLYRQDGLTIAEVAARLGVPEYRLRRAINQGSGARNFNAYLNGFRIAEAAEALADPGQDEVPILTIALDAGFGSLAPFNRAFREAKGCTPSEYRAAAR